MIVFMNSLFVIKYLIDTVRCGDQTNVHTEYLLSVFVNL